MVRWQIVRKGFFTKPQAESQRTKERWRNAHSGKHGCFSSYMDRYDRAPRHKASLDATGATREMKEQWDIHGQSRQPLQPTDSRVETS